MENQELVAYATYLLELSLPDYKMLRFSYSIIAASAVYLACRTFEHSPIPRTFSKHTGYTAADLASCVSALENLVAQAPNASLKAVYRKFCSEKFYSVANRMMHDAEDMND